MKFLLILIVVILNSPSFAQTEDSKLNIDGKILQRILDQINLPDSFTVSEGFQGEISDCDILIELNPYIKSGKKYIIDQKQACPVDKSVIFQLNREFFKIDSIAIVDS